MTVAIPPPLVGREHEQALLREKLAAVLAGRGGLVLIGGEAGIGKSALAEGLCQEAEALSALVLTGRCYDLTQTPPYGPWVGLFGQYRRADRMPPLPPAFARRGAIGAVASQATLFREVADFFTATAADRPLMLLLEDLHWADPASLDLVRDLAHDLARQSILLVATYRADELTRRNPLHTLLPLLVWEADATRIDLRRLNPRDVHVLVETRYRLPAPDTARLGDYLDRRAGGNPLFLGELLRTLAEERVLRSGGAGDTLADLTDVRIPPLLRQVIDGRLARLGAAANDLLAVAAVIGQEVPLDLWAGVSGADEESLLDAVERAVGARLLEEFADGTRARFVHALIREALYEGILPSRRRRLHRAVGEALAAPPDPDADAVAHHFRMAGDPRAATWLIAAGERAERAGAWMTAAERFEAALPLLAGRGAGAGERGWLLYRVAVLCRLGDAPRSVVALEEVGRLAEEAGAAALTAHALIMRGHVRCFASDLTRGISELEAGITAAERARREVATYVERTTGMGTLVMWLAFVGRLAEARALGEEYVAGTAVRDVQGIVRAPYVDAFWGLGDLHARLGDPEKARAAFDEARAGYDALGYASQAYTVLLNILHFVIVPYRTEALAERHRVTDEAERGAGRVRAMRGALPGGIEHLPFMTVDAIGWDEARRLAGWVAGLPAAQEWAVAVVGAVLLAQGDAETLWPLIAQLLPEGPGTEPGGVYFQSAVALQRAAASLALDAGDLPAAREWLEAHDRWLAWSGTVLGQSEGQALWAQYHRQAGNKGEAYEHAERALAHATEPQQPLALITAHRLLGELNTDAGWYDDAARHVDASLSLADACQAPYERALTLLAQAELRAAEGNPDEAMVLLDAIRATCAPLGAKPALMRVDALSVSLAPLGSPAIYPDGMTAREMQVLRHIAAGMSNREIAERLSLSVRTVERHIENLYRKIDARSKAEATAYAFRLNLV